MKNTRLESKSKNIVQRLQRVPNSQQRLVAIAAAEWALHANRLTDATFADAVQFINEHGSLSPEKKLELERLIDKFDSEYFDAQDADAPEAEVAQKFGKTRAVSALLFAGDADSFTAAVETIYEASVATENETSLLDLVISLLPQ